MEFLNGDPLTLIAMVLIVMISALISATTGMAGGVLMLSGMNIFVPLNITIPIHGMIQIFNNATRTWLLRQHLFPSLYIPFAIGAVFGAAAMTYTLIQISISEIIPLTLLLLLIGYTIFKPKTLPDIKLQFKNYFWVGIGSGALGILAGAVDPYLGAFFYRDDITKEQMVANKSVVQLIGHLTKIPAFIALGFAFSDYIGIILILGLTAIITTKVGIYCLEKISQKLFRTLLWWALFFSFLRIGWVVFEKII